MLCGGTIMSLEAGSVSGGTMVLLVCCSTSGGTIIFIVSCSGSGNVVSCCGQVVTSSSCRWYNGITGVSSNGQVTQRCY